MPSPTPRPVISGRPYAVREVHGHRPAALSDFTGQTTFLLAQDDAQDDAQDYVVCGAGGLDHDGQVRVFEKDDQGYGKDVRVWVIRHEPGTDSFTAEHCAVLTGH